MKFIEQHVYLIYEDKLERPETLYDGFHEHRLALSKLININLPFDQIVQSYNDTISVIIESHKYDDYDSDGNYDSDNGYLELSESQIEYAIKFLSIFNKDNIMAKEYPYNETGLLDALIAMATRFD
tara:strand:- start:40359 stop:40736 length:378 start_codon:yes stop_codon:yes gene_type:complete